MQFWELKRHKDGKRQREMINVKRDEEFYVILIGMEICFFT